METKISKKEIKQELLSLAMLAAVIGGIGGGIAFSILWLIQAPNLEIFKFIGTTFLRLDDPLFGAVVHFAIAIFFGLCFGISLVFIPKLGSNQLVTILSAVVFGIFIWGTLAKYIPPLLNGTPIETVVLAYFTLDNWFAANSLSSLLGHILYGFFLGLITWNLPKIFEKPAKS
jgi:hypothetical protein